MVESNGFEPVLPFVSTLRRYLRFCVVGGSGMVLDTAVLAWLGMGLGWELTPAKLLAAELALLNNFAWNERWTFRECCRSGSRWSRLAKFHLTCLTGMAIALGCLHVLALTLPLWLANPLAILVASLWNFRLNSAFNWPTLQPAPKSGHPTS